MEAVEGFVAGFGGAEVVACGKGVAGVEADGDAGGVGDVFDDGCEMLKLVAEIGSLSGGVFDDGYDVFGLVEGDVDGFGDGVQAGFFVYLFKVATWVEVESVESKLLATLHFVEEGGA